MATVVEEKEECRMVSRVGKPPLSTQDVSQIMAKVDSIQQMEKHIWNYFGDLFSCIFPSSSTYPPQFYPNLSFFVCARLFYV